MAVAGNLLTDFNFHRAKIKTRERPEALDIRIWSPDAPAQASLSRMTPPRLGPHSAFESPDEAGAFLKYKPFGISIGPSGRANVVEITRREDAWRSKLVEVVEAHWAFFDGMDVRPEVCYEVEPIDYRWNRGRTYESAGKAIGSTEGDGFLT